MGNNPSASSAPPDLASPPGVAPAPPMPSEQSTTSSPSKPSEKFEWIPQNHPGAYEDLHRKVKEVFPEVFDGCKLVMAKMLNSHFQVSHSLSLTSPASSQPSGYKFGAVFVGSKKLSETDSFPVMTGEITPSGDMNAQIIHQLTHSLRCRALAQIKSSNWVNTQLTSDYRGDDFMASLTIAEPDLATNSGIIALHYLQNITGNFSMGTELLNQFGPDIPGHKMGHISFAGRYRSKLWEAVCTVSPQTLGLHASYWHQVDPNMRVGVEFETSTPPGERGMMSVATLGYERQIPESNFSIKGQIDSRGSIASVIEKRLDPLPVSLLLSGYANYPKSLFIFGVGLDTGR